MAIEKLILRINNDVVEIWKNEKISREYIYHYVLNNRDYGKKHVNEYTRTSIVNKIYELGEMRVNSHLHPDGFLLDKIKEVGNRIYSFILSEPIRAELFDSKNFNKNLIIENMDILLPLELAFDGNKFLSLIYSIGRAVPKYPSRTDLDLNAAPLDIRILSNPTNDLQGSTKEGNQISSAINKIQHPPKGKIKLTHYEGAQVTKELVLFDILYQGKCNILHFCGHGNFNDTDPMLSSLILSDGSLRAHELEEMKGNPIVFVNACSSAIEAEKSAFFGRGLIEGMASSFVKYGAIAYIGSLWPLGDETSTSLALEFYKYFLAEGCSIGESLRKAKEKLFNSASSMDVTCLSYILFGDPSFNLYTINEDRFLLSSFLNDKAVHEIMKLEKHYSGLEMLTSNDIHWIFWNKNLVKEWSNKIAQSTSDREKLYKAFDDYQLHFRKEAIAGRKWFKLILNYKTFEKYVRNLNASEINALIFDMINFLEYKNFHMLFYLGPEEEIDEYEIVSINTDEKKNIEDNVCVVIKESRIEKDNIYYFLYFNDTPELILDHISRYDNYRKLCLQQYKTNYHNIFPYLSEKEPNIYDEYEIKKVTKYILERFLKSPSEV